MSNNKQQINENVITNYKPIFQQIDKMINFIFIICASRKAPLIWRLIVFSYIIVDVTFNLITMNDTPFKNCSFLNLTVQLFQIQSLLLFIFAYNCVDEI